MKTIRDIDELSGNAQFVASFAHAAFQHRVDMQLLADFAKDVVLIPAFESKGRTAPRHPQALHFRQNVEQLFRHAIAQVFIAFIRAHVHEWQDRDGFLCGRDSW